MNKKINILLVLLLLIVSISAVSAADDVNETISNDEIVDEVNQEDILTSTDNEIVSSSHTINKTNYYNYFDSSKGELKDLSVNEGDTINLDGDFSNVNFVFKKSIKVIGNNNVKLQNCMFTFQDSASGSYIANLNIFNTKETTYGIFLNGVNNCVITNCFINNTGASSYTICIANNANYNNVTKNNLNTYGITYGHGTRSTPPLLISGAHHNYVADNNVSCDDANAIYLSSYSGGPLKGGVSNFNIIYNNTVKYNIIDNHVYPTSWSYAIQLMGNNNTVNLNKVIGAYRGISSSGTGNIIINNRIINLTGADYNHPSIEVGGDIAIVGAQYSTIINNTILNARVLSSGAGISALDHSIVENNFVQIISRGTGIHPQGSNIIIKNNTVLTTSGAGILYNTYSFNLLVINNNITSTSGVGVLIQKLSSKRMPGNITIKSNYIFTGNKYAIDAREANADSNNDIEQGSNTIPKNGGIVATPEGEYDPSKPVYKFDGETYTVTPENLYEQFLEDNGLFKSEIKDGSILNFVGNFSNEYIIVNAKVKINGKGATFYNTTFQISSDSVWLENLVIRNNQSSKLNSWGVVAYRVFGATIKNCDIETCDPNAAYAIYVVESSNVDVLNNKLYSSGNYLTYTLLAHTVEDCNFINNTIKTVGTGDLYITSGGETCIDGSCLDGNCLDGDSLDGSCLDGNCLDGNSINGSCFDGNHFVREVYRTYGILMIYASGNTVSENKVNVTSKLNRTVSYTESTNSIVGIDLYYNSHNNLFSKNNVYAYGNDNYIYGMGVLGYYTGHDAPEGQGATNNQFLNNNIVLEGSYFVEGIVIGDESEQTTIMSNTVNVKSDCVAYGINLEMSQNSVIEKNTFTLNSDAVYGVEAFASNNNILDNNNFEVNAKQGYGFALSNSIGNKILNNKINVYNTGANLTFKVNDLVPMGVAGIYLNSNSTNNNISNNEITSKKGFAILLDSEAINNVIVENYLDSELGIGNGAVNNGENNTVEDNYKFIVTGSLQNINVNYLENGTLTFKTNDDNLEGANVEFLDIDENIIGVSIINNGQATFEYDFSEYTPAQYQIHAKVIMDNYKVSMFDAILEISKGDLNVYLYNVTGAIARTAEYKAIVKNILEKGVEGISVKFYAENISPLYYIGHAITDKNGVATLMGNVVDVDVPIVIAQIEDSDYYNSASASANLTAFRLIKTSIIVNSNVYPNGVLATLKDQNGTLLPNKLVYIKIGSNEYPIYTNLNGEIILPIISKGNYPISISFAGDEQLYDSKVSGKINVLPSLTENKDSSVYYGNTIQYKVRVKDSNGNFAAGNIVTFKINGQTYKIKTDSKGYAIKALKLKSGTYVITAEFNGDKVSNKLTFKPTLVAKNIVKKKAKKIKFTVKVVNKNGKAVKKKKVTFKIKGKKYSAKTNNKGVATVSIKNLKVGKFTITSSYGGCTIKNTIKIKK